MRKMRAEDSNVYGHVLVSESAKQAGDMSHCY